MAVTAAGLYGNDGIGGADCTALTCCIRIDQTLEPSPAIKLIVTARTTAPSR
jgi:hypothetical protein